MKVLTPHQQKGIDLLIKEIEVHIEMYNYLYPENPITYEEVVTQLSRPDKNICQHPKERLITQRNSSATYCNDCKKYI